MIPRLSLDEAVELLGFGPFQRRLLWLCGAVWAAVAQEVLLISFALPALRRDWNLSPAAAGSLATAIFLGMFAGAWFWGNLSDRVGRRPVLVWTIVVNNVCALLSALAPNFTALVVLRALTGFGVGGTLPADYAVFAEYLPTGRRGRYLVILEGFWALGALAAAALAWAVVPRWGWRPLFALGALPGLLAIAVLRRVPESPRFLVLRDREEEARQVLARAARLNGKEYPKDQALARPEAPRARPRDLWRPRFARTTALLWLIWFGISLGYYGVFTWLPGILAERGLGFVGSYAYMMGITLAQVPGYISAAYFVERLGRRPTLALYLLGSGMFTLLFAVARAPWAFVLAAVGMSFFALGAWGALYAYTPEVYPTALRTTGMGAASAMTRIAGILAPSLGAMLLGVSIPVALGTFAGAYGLSGLAALALPYETRGQPLADAVGAEAQSR